MSFLNPLFLIATGAAALPVLYHLVRRRRVQTVPFPSLMLLKGKEEELIKRRRLQDWLLMLIRALLFGLLALAFARPFLPQERLPLVTSPQRQSVVLLVDRSFSMQYGDTFERARQEALERLDDAGPGDAFSVVAFSDEAQPLTDLSTDHALHRGVIENELQPGYRSTNIRLALERARDVLSNAQHENRKVVLISDFQRSGWRGAAGEDEGLWEEGFSFEPVSVAAAEAPDNAYVEAFNLGKERTGEQVALRYDARIQSLGRSASQEKTARLEVEDELVEEKSLSASVSSQVTFGQTLTEAQTRQGQLSVTGDALPADNRFYFTYQIAERPSVLLVSDAPDQAQGGAFFLSRAFDMGDNARYRFATADRSRLSQPLQDQDAVFLTDVAALTEAQVERVRAYVEAGGGLVVGLGAQAAEAAAVVRALGVGRLEETVTPSPEAVIGEVDEQHPVFRAFSSSGALWRPAFRRYARIVPDTNATVVSTYGTGDPLLVERSLGQGKVLVYTSSFGTQWTDFPLRGAYVPFAYQLADYAMRDTEPQRLFTVGEAVPLPGPPSEEWEVRAPGNKQFTVPIDETGVGYFRETNTPGQYLAARDGERFPFSVNVAPQESDLQFRDQEEAYAAVSGSAQQEEATTTAPPAEEASIRPQDVEAEQQLWRYLILLVLGLFVLETVLANRRPGKAFGSRSGFPGSS